MVTLVNLIKQSIASRDEMWRLGNWPISPIDRLLGSSKISEVEKTNPVTRVSNGSGAVQAMAPIWHQWFTSDSGLSLLTIPAVSALEETAVFVCYQVLIVIINQGSNESLTNDEA